MTLQLDVQQRSIFEQIEAILATSYGIVAAPLVAAELARSHRIVWQRRLRGEESELPCREHATIASRHGFDFAAIREADHHLAWLLTPILAARLACDADTTTVSLRKVEQALEALAVWPSQERFAPVAIAA